MAGPKLQIFLCRKFITLILHESETFICKALKGEVIVYYCEPLITQHMEASGSPFWVKIDDKKRTSSDLPARASQWQTGLPFG